MQVRDSQGSSQVELIDSISAVLNLKRQQSGISGELTENSRINERELFSAAVHNQLSAKDKSLADDFLELFATRLANLKERQGEFRFFAATSKVLRKLVKDSRISAREMRAIRFTAFGKAQLDSDRSWLAVERSESAKSGDTPVRAIKTALQKFSDNAAASPEEIAQFQQRRKVNSES